MQIESGDDWFSVRMWTVISWIYCCIGCGYPQEERTFFTNRVKKGDGFDRFEVNSGWDWVPKKKG